MTDFSDFTENGDDQSKSTYFRFENPGHPEVEIEEGDVERMRAYYRAARLLKDSEINLMRLVGEFLVAVEKEFVQNQDGAVEAFFEDLAE